jgi:hypothetical protein
MYRATRNIITEMDINIFFLSVNYLSLSRMLENMNVKLNV